MAMAWFGLLVLSACAPVRPWERGRLARPAMTRGAASPLTDTYRSKLLESRTAGGLPGTAPGGGCGCTQ
jgi:hypothetical protein